MWFKYVETKLKDIVVKRIDHMEISRTIRGGGSPRKTIREIILKNLKIYELDRNMDFNRTI